MPIEIISRDSTILLRRQAFEAAGLTRQWVDARLNLTDEEFRVEGDLIAIGPLPVYGFLGEFIAELEQLGLVYFDDVFEVPGNWPGWLRLYAMAAPAQNAQQE